MREHLVLADERRGHVLRNHEPGVEPAVDREEGGQPLGQRRVDHALGAPLGDGRQLGHGHRQRVERERDRLAVEVPVGDEHVVVDEHERVVGRGVQLGRDHVVDVVEQVADGAVHLRRATERVGILHLVAPAVRLDDRRALEQAEQVRRRRLLPAKGAQRVDLRQEARARAVERLDGHRAGDVGRDLEPARAHEAERADGCHELRAVDERQPLLRAKLQRLETDGGERFAAGQQPPFDPRIAFADEGQREVRERCQVAARAHGATARHDREHAAVEALDQQLHDLHAGSGIALRERVCPEQHRRAHDLRRIRLPDAAGVAAQEAELELLRLLCGDGLRDEPPEARVDAVRVLALAERHASHDLARGAHAVSGLVRDAPLSRRRPPPPRRRRPSARRR